MPRSFVTSSLLLSAAAMLWTVAAPDPAAAISDEPRRPRIDCSKKANKTKPGCRNHRDSADDEIYNAAYWMAREGKYADARALLLQAANPSDPRILNSMGFTTRKLGDVDGALVYYRRALSINPDYTLARSYMGEAFVQKGDLAAAREQLGEIAKRCGTACVEYVELANHIERFGQGRPSSS